MLSLDGDAVSPERTCRVSATREPLRPYKRWQYSVALFVPVHGVTGIWGPSARFCAKLAAAEINQRGGINGREISIHTYNASLKVEDYEEVIDALIENDEIDAILGMHSAAERRRIEAAVRGRVPYIISSPSAGGALPRNVYTLGEAPADHVIPSLRLMSEKYHARRWVIVGNDHLFSRVAYGVAAKVLKDLGGNLLGSYLVAFGTRDYDRIIDFIKSHRPDCVLIGLTGQDLIDFNRTFSEANLASRVLRLSFSLDENVLLAISDSNTEGLFVSSGYFAATRSDSHEAFKERYHSRFGDRAPLLNSYGQSAYDGLKFLAGLAARRDRGAAFAPFDFSPVRNRMWANRTKLSQPIYFAEAQGHHFEVLKQF